MGCALAAVAIVVGANFEPADVPPGSDLLVRVEGPLAAELAPAVAELRPLLEAWPGMTRLVEVWDGPLVASVGRVLAAHGAKPGDRRATINVAVDLDAAGGLLWSAVVRSALGKRSELAAVEGEERFTIDEHPAARLPALGLGWAVTRSGVLILGDERGLQRHLRHLLGAQPPDVELARRAAQLRKAAPLQLVFRLPEATRARLVEQLPEGRGLLEAVQDGHLSATSRELVLAVGTDEGAEPAVQQALGGLVALLRGAPAVLEGMALGLAALDTAGSRPAGLPEALDAATLAEVATRWLAGAALQGKVVTRPPRAVQAELKVEQVRAVVLGALVLAARLELLRSPPGAKEAEQLLLALRERQRAFKKKSGAYLACGPIPAELPVEPIAWPAGSCFDQLGFVAPTALRFQLLATVEKGRLTLAARSDWDGDGVAELWVLEEGRDQVRRLAFEP